MIAVRRPFVFALAFSCALAAGCSESSGGPGVDADAAASADSGGPDTVADDASAPDASGEDVGGGDDDAAEDTDAGTADAGPAEDAASDTAPTDAGAAGGALPCEIADLVTTHCAGCHGEVPSFGAPMSLTTVADFLAPPPSGEGATVGVASLRRTGDSPSPMPPVPNPPLSNTERDTLLAWVQDGMPARVGSCGDDTPDAGADAGSDGGDAGAIIDPDLDESSCEYLIEFRAHEFSGVDDETPNVIEPGRELYECFYFDVPWGLDEAHGLWFRPLIDDSRVLHHYLLYGTDDLDQPAGTRRRCSGTHPDAALLTGWAPGGQPLVLPDDVGLQLPSGPNAGFILEIHYNNQAGYDDVADRSGVEMCATRELQSEAAATHWLGTEAILLLRQGETDLSGMCTPETDEEIHIIQSWPHMHRYGTHMTSTVLRADGSRDTIVDVPFDFDNQIPYAVDVTVQPGDQIRTTCTFNNSSGGIVGFGARTEDEMCYNFVVAYPAGALASAGMFNGGENFCLQ